MMGIRYHPLICWTGRASVVDDKEQRTTEICKPLMCEFDDVPFVALLAQPWSRLHVPPRMNCASGEGTLQLLIQRAAAGSFLGDLGDGMQRARKDFRRNERVFGVSRFPHGGF